MAVLKGSGRWVLTLVLGSLVAGPVFAGTVDPSPEIAHVVNRLSFGPRPGDLERVRAMGIEGYIQEQLHPEQIPEPPSLSARLAGLRTLAMSPAELFGEFRTIGRQARQLKLASADRAASGSPASAGTGSTPQKQALKAALVASRPILQEAAEARLSRAVESPRQLEEVMVDFWYNHFNVFAGKGLDHFLVGAYEQQAIRPFALGRFGDLVLATARHPAMLFYLDNWQNTGPDTPGARGRFKGLNENYARELMELHTLGVKGGYTQRDVTELARILTGWSFCRGGRGPSMGDGFCFDADRHDRSDKVFLGKSIRGAGIEEGVEAIGMLVASPATARYISTKLIQYFVADAPPATLVERLTRRYLDTGGDIRAMLDTLFHSREFTEPKYYAIKFKTPYRYVISSLRATGMKVETPRLLTQLRQMGMPLYGCQSPDGYKNTADAWLNPEALTQRLSFATNLAALQIDADRLAATLGNRFTARTRTAVAGSEPPLKAALLLGSPEMMYH